MDRDDENLLLAEDTLREGETIRGKIVGNLDVDGEVYGDGALLITDQRLVFARMTGDPFAIPIQTVKSVRSASDDSFLQFDARGKPSRLTDLRKGSPDEIAALFGQVMKVPAQMPVRQYPHGISCPNCGQKTPQGGHPAWQWIVGICFFPMGMLALLAGRDPTTCRHCDHTFQT